VAGQSKNLVPADGALYALRDATGTIASLPLIAASVMSKKLAVGTDLILLDIKAGTGAFMKTPQAAADLAAACVRLGTLRGRRVRAAVTDMSQPLGSAIGNALDVAEAVSVLKGEEGGRLRELTVAFAAEATVRLLGQGRADAVASAERALDSGEAADRFARMIEAQGGDPRVVDDPWAVLPRAPVRKEVNAPAGYLAAVEAERLGELAVQLGAGRARKGDPVDPAVGIEFFPKIGDRLSRPQPVAVVHARSGDMAEPVARAILDCITVQDARPEAPGLLYGWYGEGGDEGP
jgi:pyrimidine-nucleoside phosphorylase